MPSAASPGGTAMNRHDELRARIRRLVATTRGHMHDELLAVLEALHPGWPAVEAEVPLSSTRVNSLRNAAGWHRTRRSAGDRLAHLAQEVRRMQDHATNPAHQQF